MKTKSLITMAIASTFGWSAGVFAGTGHEVVTPYSPSESGENIVARHHGFHSTAMSTAIAPSESLTEATGHDLALSDTSDWSASFDQMAEANMSDVYLIGFAPLDSWDYYIIDMSAGDELALLDDETYYLVPFDIALVSDEGYSMTQEDQVAMVLWQDPVIDTAEVG